MFSQKIAIGNRNISLDDPVYFIADIAANHDGSLERAKDLIFLAKKAGADCVKFQHFLANKIVSDYGFKHLQAGSSHQASWKKSVYQIYDEYHCKREWTQELVKTCNELNIEFMSTPYDDEAIALLNPYVHAFKIGSGDITWHEFLQKIALTNKPVLLATGASTEEDVILAVDVISKINSQIVLMQCNTNYTADLDNYKYINLNVLHRYKALFNGMILGLSDHTFGHATVLGAVALGARVIEKHFTDDNQREGPDHKFAMNPKTWSEMVLRTRELEQALGNGIKQIEQNEKETVIVQRRSIRLNKKKNKGERIVLADLEYLRPAPINSFCPYEFEQVVGKTLTVDKEVGDCIYKDEIQ